MRARGERLRRTAWIWRAALAAAALTLLPGRAHAGDITWRAPPECQRADVAKEQVEKLVGQKLESIEAVAFEVEVSIDADATHRVLLRTLAQGSAPRERAITGPSCESVTDAVSVAIALTINEEEQRAQAAEAAAEDEAEVASDAQPEPVPEPATEPAKLRFALGLGALLDVGALPDPVVGLDLGAALELDVLRLGASVAVFMPQEAELPDGSGGGRFDFVAGGLDLCGHPVLSELHLLACAGFELGRIGARGTGVRNWRSGDSGWYAPRVLVGVGYGFAKIARVWLRGGVAIPLARSEFLVDDALVHQPGSTVLRAGLAVELVL